jgi:hypothetical protein
MSKRVAVIVAITAIILSGLISHLAKPSPTSQPGNPEVYAFLAPPQDSYKSEPRIIASLDFLSRRWKTKVQGLYVVAMRPLGALLELGIVDSSSLTSARVIVTDPNFANPQDLQRQSIGHESDIYLANEFSPATAQEINITRQFYATETPSLGNPKAFAVIIWWDVTQSGDGKIKALTNAGYVVVPVRSGTVLKQSAYLAD